MFSKPDKAKELAAEFVNMHPVEQKFFIEYLKDEGWNGERIETLENLININTGIDSVW